MRKEIDQPIGFVAETLERVYTTLRPSGYVPFPDEVIEFLTMRLGDQKTKFDAMMQLFCLCSLRPDDPAIIDMLVVDERLLYRAAKGRVVAWGRTIYRPSDFAAGPSIVQGRVAYARKDGEKVSVTIAGRTVVYPGPIGRWMADRHADNSAVMYETDGGVYANFVRLFDGTFDRIYAHRDGIRLGVRPTGESFRTFDMRELGILPPVCPEL